MLLVNKELFWNGLFEIRNRLETTYQVSEVIEGTVTKKLSQKFSSTKSRVLGALSKLDIFLNSQVHMGYGTVPGTSRNSESENQELNEDRSQNDPHPEVRTSVSRSPHSVNSDPVTQYIIRGFVPR